jgi:hypothetical protein
MKSIHQLIFTGFLFSSIATKVKVPLIACFRDEEFDIPIIPLAFPERYVEMNGQIQEVSINFGSLEV